MIGDRRASLLTPLAVAAGCAALGATLAVAGCGDSEKPTPAPSVAVTLLETGREPRAALRYPSEPTPPTKMSLSLRLAMKMEVPGSPVPPVTMPGLRLLLDIASVRADDKLRYQFTVADADDLDRQAHRAAAESARGWARWSRQRPLMVDAAGAQRIGLRAATGIGKSWPVQEGRMAIGRWWSAAREPVGTAPSGKVEMITQDGHGAREDLLELVALDGRGR